MQNMTRLRKKKGAKGRLKEKIAAVQKFCLLFFFFSFHVDLLAKGAVMLVWACNGHLTCVSGQQQDLSGQHGHILF